MSGEINSEFGLIFIFCLNLTRNKQTKNRGGLKTSPFGVTAWRAGDEKWEVLGFFGIKFKETMIFLDHGKA